MADRARCGRPVAAAPDGDPADAPGPERESVRPADLRHGGHALVGRLADLRQRSRLRARDPHGRGRPVARHAPGAAARGRRSPRRPARRRGQLLGRPRAAARPLHARAQRDLRAAPGRVPGAGRPGALREGASRQCRADGEDPHDRLDAGDHRPPDDSARAARKLVWRPRRAVRQDLRPAHAQRVLPRHPRVEEASLRRPVRADRGVRRGLPDAPADPRRLHVLLARRRITTASATR